jgi:hypothetical protein
VSGYREFQTGEVLTAANVNGFLMNQAVMVFDDAAARTTALAAVLTEGMLTYNKDVQSLEVYDGTDFVALTGGEDRRIEAFTASGTWTPPADVTYAIAHVLGGGGSVNIGTAAAGGASSVAFSSGTITGAGGAAGTLNSTLSGVGSEAAPANSGRSGYRTWITSSNGQGNGRTSMGTPGDAAWMVGEGDCTPGVGVTVTVGDGGTTGTAGGSGFVYIEYWVPR